MRERGKFWPKKVVLSLTDELSMVSLKAKILETMRADGKKSEVTKIYFRFDKTVQLLSDNHVSQLKPYTELEAILVDDMQ